MDGVRIGTCSWKYPSWKGLVYSAAKGIDYLAEYARKYDTVEVDQWFWSLFPRTPVALPKPETVRGYGDAVGPDFRFTVKAPNAVTLTHYYQRQTAGALLENPHFLSVPLMERFIELLEPIAGRIGAVMLQFEYLNRQKMRDQGAFLERLDAFHAAAPRGVTYAVEVRNPRYLNARHFAYLRGRAAHVYMQGYYMPDIRTTFAQHGRAVDRLVVVRLHGEDREGIEERTGRVYDRIVDSRDEELPGIIAMVQDFRRRGIEVYLNVNNHYEGSAPLTIEKIRRLLVEHAS